MATPPHLASPASHSVTARPLPKVCRGPVPVPPLQSPLFFANSDPRPQQQASPVFSGTDGSSAFGSLRPTGVSPIDLFGAMGSAASEPSAHGFFSPALPGSSLPTPFGSVVGLSELDANHHHVVSGNQALSTPTAPATGGCQPTAATNRRGLFDSSFEGTGRGFFPQTVTFESALGDDDALGFTAPSPPRDDDDDDGAGPVDESDDEDDDGGGGRYRRRRHCSKLNPCDLSGRVDECPLMGAAQSIQWAGTPVSGSPVTVLYPVGIVAPQPATLGVPGYLTPVAPSSVSFQQTGPRSSQQDRLHWLRNINTASHPGTAPTAYCAVFDGHGGEFVAEWAESQLHAHIAAAPMFATNLPQAAVEGMLHADEKLRQQFCGHASHCGTTASVALLRERELVVGNLGDSRAVLSMDGGQRAVPMSWDQRPDVPVEVDRIRREGGVVEHERLNGELAVSRALGDFNLKGGPGAAGTGMGAVAEVAQCVVADRHDFLLLASDGLWDKMTNEDAVTFIHRRLNGCPEGDPRMPARNAVLSLVSCDDLAARTHSPFGTATSFNSSVAACHGSALTGPPSGPCTPRDPLQSAVEALVHHAVVHCSASDNVTAAVLRFHESGGMSGRTSAVGAV